MDMKELLEGLSYNEKRLLLALNKNNGRGSPADMIRIGGFGLEVEVMGSASWLASKGLAEISEESTKYFELTDPEASRKGLPERNALKVLDAHGGSITLTDFAAEMNGEDNIAVGWLMRKKLASMQEVSGEKGLVLSDNGKAMLSAVMPDEELISRMLEAPVPEAEADAKIIKDLKGRKGMIKEVVETVREIRLTDDGVKAARSGIEVREEVTEVTDEIIQRDLKIVEEVAKSQKAVSVTPSFDAKEIAKWTDARKSVLASLSVLKPGYVSVSLADDMGVPVSKVPQAVEFFQKTAEKYNVTIATYGHASDGNLHTKMVLDPTRKDEWERGFGAVNEIFAKCVELGGTVTGEHGVGISKALNFQDERKSEIEVIKAIKAAFDPKNILNPGKAEQWTGTPLRNLRYPCPEFQ